MEPAWQNISDPIFHFAETQPQAPAIIDGGATLTYGEFATLIGKAAVHFRDVGLSAGDRVGIALANSADHLILSMALMRIGCVTVELPAFAPPQEHAGMVRRFEIGTLFSEADAEAPKGVSSIRYDVGWRSLIERKSGDYRHTGSDDEFYSITLTSGSTGQSKGIITTHAQRFARARAASNTFSDCEAFSPTRPAYFLASAGFSFTGFFQFLLNQLFVGGPVVILPEFTRAADLIRTIASWKDVVTVVTPVMCRAFVASAPSRGLLFPHLRALIALGLPMFAAEKRTIHSRVTPNLYDHYGTTAFGVISALHPEDLSQKADSVGRVAADTEVQIVDSRGNFVPFGQIGHLRCRGPAMSTGFYGEDNVATGPEGFRDGWYYPGDLATVDDVGYIYIKGRLSDLVLRRGLEIYPPEVEQILLQHPAVGDVAVVGVPLPNGQQEMVAFIVARGEAKHDELVLHCRAWLAPEKQPDRLFYTDALPRTPIGKVDRQALRALALRDASRKPPAVA